ncbi:MAG: hypothetical protein Q7T86_03280 [Hyphomicrobiaceae bacterium]|nr:hypothetical protein [Hyphomicrobiaceae bacterium]
MSNVVQLPGTERREQGAVIIPTFKWKSFADYLKQASKEKLTADDAKAKAERHRASMVELFDRLSRDHTARSIEQIGADETIKQLEASLAFAKSQRG